MNSTPDKKESTKNKKKGPIRFEAIVPVSILSIITFLYFSFYFDHHMKKIVEYVGTQANGAEVNVDSLRTSFFKGSFDLNRLQVTNPEQPNLNSIEIGNIHFQYLWDALLRMKFVVEDASINNIQLMKPRSSPGHILPPKPAAPGQIESLQNQVIAQVKNKYGGNILSDVLSVLEGGDTEAQIKNIRETLKSETRVNSMLSEVTTKKEFWDDKVKELSDTTKLKEIESTIQSVKSEKNLIQQAQGIKKLTDLLKGVEKQYKEIDKSSKQLQSELKVISDYPKELENLVNEDIASLKNRFSIPEIDFKDMAMHLFAGEFVQYIAKARKYQAIAEQYLPEKKKEEDVVIPRKRSEGKSYQYPITTGYPLFWLKRAAISSKGTPDSYSGNVSGELTNVTTSPKQIKKPIVLDMRGDFPAAKMSGVKAVITSDFTKDIGKQSALIQVNSFEVPEKMFVNDTKLKFGFRSAVGSSTLNANLEEDSLIMSWNSTLTGPKFLVETSNNLAKEILTNVVNNIPVIKISGNAKGNFSDLQMDMSSNLGTELGEGFSREIGAKVTEAQNKINTLVNEKINQPKQELMKALNLNSSNLKQLGNLDELYKKHEVQIKAEIENLKNGKSLDSLKEQGKKIFKGIKF